METTTITSADVGSMASLSLDGATDTTPPEAPVEQASQEQIDAAAAQQAYIEAQSKADGGGLPDQPEVVHVVEHVWSYEQALSLPEIQGGTRIDELSPEELDALHVAQGGTNLNKRTPIYAFKGADRRTMVVVRDEDGSLAAADIAGFR